MRMRMRGAPATAAALLIWMGLSPGAAMAAKDPEGADLPSMGRNKGEHGKPSSASGTAKNEEPTFEETIKDCRKIDGLLPLYEKDGRYLMEIRPDQLDQDLMLSITRETGVGQIGLLAVQVLGDGPVRFHKVGKRVQFLMRNTRFAAQDDPDVRRAVEKSFSDSLQGSARIESQPHPDTKAVLVDVAPLFVWDVEGLGAALGALFQTPYNVDRENSYISAAKGFPLNVELEARLHFASSKPFSFTNLPDPRSLFVSYRYSISRVPAAADFIPRIADDRVGHFLAMYQDFSDDSRDTPYVRYVTRWSLQKEEPYAAMSKPVEPITFWLENSIPKKYRKAMADGILMWNQAFEKVGFKDAVVVKQQPDDADWDPADVRYSTVRWFIATDTAFAIGPSRINPMTGQIFDADISWSDSLISGKRREFEEMADPVKAIQALFAQASGAQAAGADPRLSCAFAAGALRQLEFGSDLLEARGMEPGSPEADEYVNGFITYVMAHEVGHTLGLRHNFRASVVQPLDRLQDAASTKQSGLTGSVMDYVPVNLAAQGQRQGQYWQSTLGPYDYWAIEYAYKPMPGIEQPADELPELRAIASRVARSGNSYGTDEDTSDPRTNIWDLGSDPVAFYAQRADLVRELWGSIPSRLARPGEDYSMMRRAFGRGMGQFGLSVVNVTKTIGGLYTHRDHMGDPDGRLPLQPVSAEHQREALAFLRKNLFSGDAFRLQPDLLNRLAASRWLDFTGTVFTLPRIEYPLHDVVLVLQRGTLDALYNPVKLARLVDLELQFPAGVKPFTLAEMFQDLRQSIWSEVHVQASTPTIDGFRRALQREHMKRLIDLMLKPAPGVPEDAMTLARADLMDLKGALETALNRPGLDAGSRAHLDESRARIDAALAAQMLRLTS